MKKSYALLILIFCATILYAQQPNYDDLYITQTQSVIDTAAVLEQIVRPQKYRTEEVIDTAGTVNNMRMFLNRAYSFLDTANREFSTDVAKDKKKMFYDVSRNPFFMEIFYDAIKYAGKIEDEKIQKQILKKLSKTNSSSGTLGDYHPEAIRKYVSQKISPINHLLLNKQTLIENCINKKIDNTSLILLELFSSALNNALEKIKELHDKDEATLFQSFNLEYEKLTKEIPNSLSAIVLYEMLDTTITMESDLSRSEKTLLLTSLSSNPEEIRKLFPDYQYERSLPNLTKKKSLTLNNDLYDEQELLEKALSEDAEILPQKQITYQVPNPDYNPWIWLENGDFKKVDVFFPVEEHYYYHPEHPEYRIYPYSLEVPSFNNYLFSDWPWFDYRQSTGYCAYDKDNNLVAVSFPYLRNKELVCKAILYDYLADKYGISSENINVKKYLDYRLQLGPKVITNQASHERARKYMQQLLSDHEKDDSSNWSRIDGLSFICVLSSKNNEYKIKITYFLKEKKVSYKMEVLSVT